MSIKDKFPPVDTKNRIRDGEPKEEYLHFSFKFFDSHNPKFSILNREARYFVKVLERLKNICSFKLKELLQSKSHALRVHPIEWERTTEPKGFSSLNKQLGDCMAYQFEITANEHGRVHGFLLGNIFHIVWLDPNHKLFEKKK